MRFLFGLTVILALLLGASVSAQTEPPVTDSVADSVEVPAIPPPAPVTDLKALDTDDDHGHSVTLTWTKSVDAQTGQNTVNGHQIFRWYPAMMDSLAGVDSLKNMRQDIQRAQSANSVFRRALGVAEDALEDLTSGGRGFDALRFTVATPQDDSTFVLDRAFVEQALRDTVATMTTHLPLLPDSIKGLQASFEAAIERLTEAHQAYPEGGSWNLVGLAAKGDTSFVNSGNKDPMSGDFIKDFTDLYYRVDVVTIDETIRTESAIVGPVQSEGQWFNGGRFPVFWAVIIFGFLTMYFVSRARKGDDLYVRPLAGIEAVDDAIGRATEMGRPILYVLGLGTAADVATIASFTVLGRVAKQVAEYQTELIVPTYDPIVMSVAQEVVKSSYLDAGRPDDYKENTVFFVTNLQFAYVAAVNGIMLRELPATNIYMGKFFAESLLLAETGALAGSIQIAGTDEIAQIPFFIVACDYTLIGEELYAASAYLGREPILLGSLKAQDWAKAAVIVLGIVGLVAANLEWGFAKTFLEYFHVTN
ncbi:MAG: hypothetical protein GY867_05650 [bacterium]|nr:hypothetical protein [bacterium]